MSIESDYALSFYKELTRLHENRDIYVVQHIETKRIFVKKSLSVFDMNVYQFLMRNPHPGIPRVHELIVHGDQLVVIEDYVSGSSLKDILHERGWLGEDEARQIILQLCDILTWLHRAHPPVIHRDIKPANLILADDQTLALIDFNAAKAAQELKSKDTVLIGTTGYAAPEQYGFASSNAQTDIYAVGVLLNEMLTGKLISDEIYTGPLAGVIRKCTAFDPKQRYEHILQLKKALSSQARPIHTSGDRSTLPPGFRTKTPWKMAVASIGYLLYLFISVVIEVEGTSAVSLWLNRLAIWLIFTSITFFIANYRNIHSYLPLTSSSNRLIKAIGVLIGSFIIFIALMSFLVIFESLIT